MEDIYPLALPMRAGTLHGIFEDAWKKEQEQERKDSLRNPSSSFSSFSFFTGLLTFFIGGVGSFGTVVAKRFRGSNEKKVYEKEEEEEEEMAKEAKEKQKLQNQKSIFLAKVLFRAFGWEYLSAGILKLAMILTTYLSPQLMTLLLNYIQSRSSDSIDPPQPTDQGIAIVGAMILLQIIDMALGSMFDWICDMTTYKARSALMTDVFKKSLRMKHAPEPGDVVTRFSSDTSSVTGAFGFLHLLWAAPIELGVTLYLLYTILGPSSFMALGTSMVVGGISALMTPYLVKKTELMMKMNDKRINLVSGTFGFAQSIKLYGWESLFLDKITQTRNSQLKELGGVMIVTAFIGGLVSSAVNLIVLGSLGVYAATAPTSQPLDLPRIFVGMSLLNTLQAPLNQISGFYSQIMQLSVSFKRLTTILCSEEVDPPTANQTFSSSSDICVSIRSATFMSIPDPEEEEEREEAVAVLHSLSLDIPRGKLTAIVGETGSGKSSLLEVIGGLGLLSLGGGGGGRVARNEGCTSFAYSPQEPWIFNGNVRDNILFHDEYEAEWYQTVLSACALQMDLKGMKGRDMAELNGGQNLSGGQRQRISLARAVYASRRHAHLFLFDDPLSAVDAKVSAHIFENVMSSRGVLGEKTRVLCMNRLDLLPKCDHVIVMSKGTVLMQGHYDDLVAHGNESVHAAIAFQTTPPTAHPVIHEEEEEPAAADDDMNFFYPLDELLDEGYPPTAIKTHKLGSMLRRKNATLGSGGTANRSLKRQISDSLERETLRSSSNGGTKTRAMPDVRNAAFAHLESKSEQDVYDK
jgi:ATP-binding cassette subfamily C (CFTR/MRP) protein 1